MVRHIVMWNYADGFSDDQNIANAQKMKAELEGLVGTIDGLKSIKIIAGAEALLGGNRDIVLTSLFESEEALKNYISHPEHVRIGTFVRSVTKDRASADYYE